MMDHPSRLPPQVICQQQQPAQGPASQYTSPLPSGHNQPYKQEQTRTREMLFRIKMMFVEENYQNKTLRFVPSMQAFPSCYTDSDFRLRERKRLNFFSRAVYSFTSSNDVTCLDLIKEPS
jgi:hypothetical protein